MKLCHILHHSRPALCAQTSAGLFDLSPAGYHSLRDAIARPEGLKAALAAAEASSSPILLQDAEFLPVIDAPEKIICIGVNYFKHIRECGEKEYPAPVLFSKFNNALAAHNALIRPPKSTAQLDYEAELVIIMGRGGKDIPACEALDYVFGYTCGNDLSARDLQMRTSQWLSGKSCDGFAPIGPCAVTADAVNPHDLHIESRLNGEIRQSSSTANMIFSCEEIISYVSSLMTLKPGDLIFTGTPEGVILGQDADTRKWMHAGDVVEVEIEGIGILRNTVGSAV